ncbi:MAG: S41 family peptidase [Candidatus Izemoplasmatales bacterium]
MKKLMYGLLIVLFMFLGGCGQSVSLTTSEQPITTDSGIELVDVEVIKNDLYSPETFTLDDMQLKLIFSDGAYSLIDISEDMIQEDISSLNQEGTYQLTIEYLSFEKSFEVIIEDDLPITQIEVGEYDPYFHLPSFNINQILLNVTRSHDVSYQIPLTYDMINQSDTNKLFTEGIHEITVNYEGKETSFMIALIDDYPSLELLESEKDIAVFYEVLELLQSQHRTRPEDTDLYIGALNGMIQSLNDPYTRYFDSDDFEKFRDGLSESYVGLGLTINNIDNQLVVTGVYSGSPAEDQGIFINDVIKSIDGVLVTPSNISEIVSELYGSLGETIRLGIERPGVENIIEFELEYKEINTPSIETNLVDDKYGLIKVNSFGSQTADLFKDAIHSLEDDSIEGLVIDLRNNGGGYLDVVLEMMQLFLLDNGKPIMTIESFVGGYNTNIFYGTIDEKKPYEIVVLVNEGSASASEVFAIGMQEHGGYLVVGTQTFGKGTIQKSIAMKEKPGDFLNVTYGKWLSPLGNWLDKYGGSGGLMPDVIAERDIYESLWKIHLEYDEVIEYDSVDDRLSRIQTILNGMGYSVRTDGYYDDETKVAIEDIQLENGLSVSGNIDQETILIINDWLNDYQSNTDTQLDQAIETLKNQ